MHAWESAEGISDAYGSRTSLGFEEGQGAQGLGGDAQGKEERGEESAGDCSLRKEELRAEAECEKARLRRQAKVGSPVYAAQM